MITRKRLLKVLALGALGIVCATLLAGWRTGRIATASAQEPPPRERQHIATLFGMHTLEPRQTAQITVVNPSEIIPCVRVRLAFDIYEQDQQTPHPPRRARSNSTWPPALRAHCVARSRVGAW